MDSNWNNELVNILDKIRINSLYLSERHRRRFIEFKSFSKWFDLPVIVCSVFSSSFGSLGSVPSQQTQMITTSISMGIAVITSIKLYLNLANNINEEVGLSKDFYILSVSIFKILSLKESDRGLQPSPALSAYLNCNYVISQTVATPWYMTVMSSVAFTLDVGAFSFQIVRIG